MRPHRLHKVIVEGVRSKMASYSLSSTAHHLHKTLLYLDLHLVATETIPFCSAVLLSYFQQNTINFLIFFTIFLDIKSWLLVTWPPLIWALEYINYVQLTNLIIINKIKKLSFNVDLCFFPFLFQIKQKHE